MAASYEPYPKQREAHKAFLVDGYKLGVLYWGRRCFTGDALVMTASGVEVPIKDVRPGMWVVSYNKELGIAEPKEVLEHHKYGVDIEPKPLIQFMVNGKTITSTYDHEFYTDRGWLPAYQLTWGALAPSERVQLKLLCEQYGQTFDDEALWRVRHGSNETSIRRFWVFQNSDGRQNGQSASGSSPDMDSEPSEQAASQPHRPRPDEQQNRQSGVGDEGRERGAHDESRATKQKSRREVRNPQANSQRGMDNHGVPAKESTDEQVSHESLFSASVRDKTRQYKRYFKGQELEISKARVLKTQRTYDLTVADNHNYVVHGLLVHNTGKTLWSIQQLMWSCMLNQGPHHIVFKEYQHAETVAWNQYLHLIPKELIKNTDKTLLTVTFNAFQGQIEMLDGSFRHIVHDPDKPNASIRFLGSDKADAHRGGESFGMIFDEYQDQDRQAWDFVYEPFLLTTDGWACFMGTAKDKDSWNELLDRAQHDPDYYFSRATWRDNPDISPERIAKIRKRAQDEDRLGAFLQEHELIPYSQQGAVYPLFARKPKDEGGHLVKPDEIPAEGTDYVTIDFGFGEGHPLAICFVRIDRDDVWWQYDEIHGTGIQLDDALAEMKIKLGDRKLTAIIADSARPDLIDYMASKGYPVVPSPKKQNSILSGIDLLRKRIKPKIQLVGPPRPNYYVSTNCKKTIYDWTHYRYKEVKEERPPSELPEKKFDDSLDSLRYLELFFKFGHPKDEKTPKNSMVKDLNSYGLL